MTCVMRAAGYDYRGSCGEVAVKTFVVRLIAGIGIVALTSAQRLPLPDTPVELRDGSGLASDLPRPAIILFWAVWCAPCRKEVAALDRLDRAAAPVPIFVVPIDDDARSRRALAGIDPRRLRSAGSRNWAWMQRLSGGSAGLPVSIAIDGEGRVCGVGKRITTPERIAAWRQRCGWPPAP